MNLRQLEVFMAVVQEGSFSKGAQRCLLSQSTVSQHVATLEEGTGVLLLERGGRKVQPTEAGQVLYRYGVRMMALREEAEASLAGLKGLECGSLRLGGSNIPAVHIIPGLFGEFHRRHPSILLNLVQADSLRVTELVREGELDLGIVGASSPGKALSFRPLMADRLILVAPGGHELAGKDRVSLAELRAHCLIGREPGSGTRKAILEALGKVPGGSELNEGIRLGSNEAVKEAILLGLGLGFVSSLSVERELSRGDLVEVALEGLPIERSLYLVCSERPLSSAAQAFLCFLEAYCP